MLEFNPSIGCGELPVGLGVIGIAIVLPSCNFVYQGLLVRDAAIEALGRKDAESDSAISSQLPCFGV